MSRLIHLEPHLTNEELHDRYHRARDAVERSHWRFLLIRSTTLFYWWPKRIRKRQAPRRN